MWIAHYNKKDNSNPHLLCDHVSGMLNILNQFNISFDRYGMTKSSITLHDVGKKSKRFQEYVVDFDGKRGTVKHAIGGAFALHHQKLESLNRETNYISELVQLIVASHHTGLYDFDKDFFDRLTHQQLPKELSNIEELAQKEVEEVLSILDGKSIKGISSKYDNDKFCIYVSLLVRFVMSALTDADYLDTNTYFSQQKPSLQTSTNIDFSRFQKKLKSYIDKLNEKSDNSNLNKLRNGLQKKSFTAGGKIGTFFTLDAPTGTGKTLAALQFALEHAKEFNKSRVITALPLINLTEEISDLYCIIFGEPFVTEDHSGLIVKDTNSLKYIASERWSSPFIVTTTVQLFESLFHHRPSKLRKLHHLYNSIIIIDEFHQLPLHVLDPIMKVLDMLQSKFKVTVLLMSATPFPLLESRAFKKMGLMQSPESIIKNKGFFESLPKRITYEFIGVDFLLSDVAKSLTSESSVLAIVNTRKQAQQLFSILKKTEHGFDAIYHLSTTMCGYHRRKIIQKIKENQKNGGDKKIAVISTSILEAGVDISFPIVYRMMAPLDSIIQAAGRCNRHNEVRMGRVVLFNLKDVTYHDEEFEAGVRIVEQSIKDSGLNEFTNKESFISYYKNMLSQVDLNETGIDNYLMFRSVSTSFKVIEDERSSVLCPMVEGFNRKWLTEKRTRTWWKKVKPFIVSIPGNMFRDKGKEDLVVWKGDYDTHVGIKL